MSKNYFEPDPMTEEGAPVPPPERILIDASGQWVMGDDGRTPLIGPDHPKRPLVEVMKSIADKFGVVNDVRIVSRQESGVVAIAICLKHLYEESDFLKGKSPSQARDLIEGSLMASPIQDLSEAPSSYRREDLEPFLTEHYSKTLKHLEGITGLCWGFYRNPAHLEVRIYLSEIAAANPDTLAKVKALLVKV